VLAGEFDLEAILAAIPARFAYRPVPRFPAALRDVAVVVPEAATAERVLAELRTAGGDLLRHVRLFDLYRGPSIPDGTKSLAFALTYQADDRTLTDKEVDKAHKKIEDRLVHVLKGRFEGRNKRTTEAQRTQREETQRKPQEFKTMDERDPLSEQVIGAAIEVHRVLGPGLLESVYQKCLGQELTLRGIPYREQVDVPIVYKGTPLTCTLFMDLVVADQLVLELKTVDKLLPIHEAQLLTYLRLSGIHRGLLLNFNVRLLKDGLKRMVL
jgi:GxxExxY protein